MSGERGLDSHLPATRTTFRGREEDLAELEGLVEWARLITLTGLGGCGKTRLALELGNRVRQRFEGGVILVDFSPVTEPALVVHALARSLSPGASAQGASIEFLAQRLGGRRTLLIFDNCEHLSAAISAVADALTLRCPDLVIVSTSREILGLTGEVRRVVRPLPIEPDAVALFADRAAELDTTFELTPANRATAAAICARLDGIPLAIELAAPWILHMSPTELLQRLDDRLTTPLTVRRDAPGRQRTLRATLDWSHRLLTVPQAILFRRLATFAGAFQATAAEEICGWDPLDRKDVVGLLVGLCERSMLSVDRLPDMTARYRLLATLRDYGRGWLQEAGEEQEVRRRHLDHYLERAEQIDEERMVTGSDAGVVTLLADVAELHGALSWSVEQQPDEALRLAGVLESFWMSTAVGEGRYWLLASLGRSTERTRHRARALMSLPLIAVQESWPQTRAFMEESVSIWRELDDQRGEAMGLLAYGNAAWFAGELDTAREHLESAVERLSGLGFAFGTARATIHLGTVLTNLPGRLDEGRALLAQGLAMVREHGDDWGQVYALALLGWADILAGAREAAARHLREALHGRLQAGVTATAVAGLGLLALADDSQRALRLLGAAGGIRDRAGVPRFPFAIQRRFDQARMDAERQLDPRVATRVWDQGRATVTEVAIADALAEREELSWTSPRSVTERQLTVARLVAAGLSNKEIGSELRVSVRTVEKHLDNLFTVLDLHNRTQVAAWYRDLAAAEVPT